MNYVRRLNWYAITGNHPTDYVDAYATWFAYFPTGSTLQDVQHVKFIHGINVGCDVTLCYSLQQQHKVSVLEAHLEITQLFFCNSAT